MIAETTPPISFRRLTAADLPLMHRWLQTEHVARWFDEADSLDAVAAEYLPLIDGTALADPYLFSIDGSPAGYIQTYLLRDDPEYHRHVGGGEGAAGIDLFIGEVRFLYRGLGASIIRAFLRDVVFVRADVDRCLIGPAVSNQAGIRAYEKAGFRHVHTVVVPDEAEPEYVMAIERSAVM